MQELLKKTTVYCGIFLAVAMCAIVYFSAVKKIEISNVGQDEISAMENMEDSETGLLLQNELVFSENDTNVDYLSIPLPNGTQAEDISIENHYMDSELYIMINDIDIEFYKTGVLSGNRDNIEMGTYEEYDKGVKLIFSMNGVYEYKTVLENNSLYVTFCTPKEMYDRIVVIDPSHGGSDLGINIDGVNEKDIVLAVTKELKTLLDDDNTIKAYYTRMDDINPSEKMRVDLPNKIHADAYIRIELDKYDDSSIYGVTCLYNDEYFIPGFGNVELANIMETAVVTEAKDKALGLMKSTNYDYSLSCAVVPSTTVKIGCLSNKQEAILLSRQDYIEKIARGIYNGIKAMYETKEQQ